MAEDIGVELYNEIQSDFAKLVEADTKISKLKEAIKAGTAKSREISRYAYLLGVNLRKAIEKVVRNDRLPDGRMYYNIAQKILVPSLRNNYDLINTVAEDIQKVLDSRQGLTLRAAKADFPIDRVLQAVGAASEEGIDEQTMVRRLASPAENITASLGDDYVKANANFRSSAGLKVYAIRDDYSGCCDWCARLAGRYDYPAGVPADFFKRHDNCRCTTEIYTEKSNRRSLTDLVRMPTAAELQQRRELSESSEPVRLSPEQAAEREAEAL